MIAFPEAWRIIRVKVICKKKVTWKETETTVQRVLCQRRTHYSQRYCTTGFTPDFTVSSRHTREGFDDHTKHWIIQQSTGCERRVAESGVP